MSYSAEDLSALKAKKLSSSVHSFVSSASDNTVYFNFYKLFLRALNLCQEKHCLLNGIIRLTWFLVVHVKFLVSCILNDPYSGREININSCFILCSDNWGKTTLNEEVILCLGESKWANKYTNKISRSHTHFLTKARVGWSKVLISRALPFLMD